MMLLLGGTRESVEVAGRLRLMGRRLLVSVATDEGREALGGGEGQEGIEVLTGPLDSEDIEELIKKRGVDLLLDCTHPFAAEVSRNAIQACGRLSVRYIRLERPGLREEGYPGLIRVSGFEAAADMASEIEGAVMLTIGVNHLGEFIDRRRPGQRLVARVLPLADSIGRCRELGLAARDIVAAHGPFGAGFNQAMFEEYQVAAVVTKDSGEAGGVKAKLEAARRLGIKLILVGRPPLDYPELVNTVDELLERL